MYKSFAWYETTLATTLGGEIDPYVGRWFYPTRCRGSLWRHSEHGVAGLELVHGNWWLSQTFQSRTPTMHDRSPRPLHPPNGCRSPSQYCPSTPDGLLQASRQRISTQTVRNRLHENGLHSRQSARGPILTREHCRARLDFAHDDHQHWQLRHWRPILFTDELRFHVSTCDQRVRLWRRAGERYADSNIIEHDRYGGGSVMVWGGICLDGRTDLVVIDRGALTAVQYRDEVLELVARPLPGL